MCGSTIQLQAGPSRRRQVFEMELRENGVVQVGSNGQACTKNQWVFEARANWPPGPESKQKALNCFEELTKKGVDPVLALISCESTPGDSMAGEGQSALDTDYFDRLDDQRWQTYALCLQMSNIKQPDNR